MKRFITLLSLLLVSILLVAQQSFKTYKVPDATTNINSALSEGDEIVNYGTHERWTIEAYYPSGAKTLNTITSKELINAIQEAPEDGNQYARQDANWSEIVIPEPVPSADASNYVNFTGTAGSSATANADSLDLAFTRGSHVFIKAGTYFMGSTSIPEGKAILFERGAIFNVTGGLTIRGEVQAGQYQIFTPTSSSNMSITNTATASPHVEWFGAIGDSVADASAGIQATMDVFTNYPHNQIKIYALGNIYILNSTIECPRGVDFNAGNNTVFYNTSTMYDPLLRVTEAPFWLQGGLWRPLRYDDMSGGTEGDAYTNWLWDFVLEASPFPEQGYPYVISWRRDSYIKDVRLDAPRIGQNDRAPLIPNGLSVRLKNDDAGNQSGFVFIDNFYVGSCDTGVYIRGIRAGFMINTWIWQGCKFDANIHGLVIGEQAMGHIFSGCGFQARNSSNTISGIYPTIDVNSNFTQIDGMMWDAWHDSTIVFRSEAGACKITGLGVLDIYTLVTNDYSNGQPTQNAIGDYPLFEADGDSYLGNIEYRGSGYLKVEDFISRDITNDVGDVVTITKDVEVSVDGSATARINNTRADASGGSQVELIAGDPVISNWRVKVDPDNGLKFRDHLNSVDVVHIETGSIANSIHIDSDGMDVTVPLIPVEFVMPPKGSAPSTPSTGNAYYDTSTNSIKIWNGTGWDTFSRD